VPAGYDLARQGNATIAPGSIEAYTSAAIPGWRSSLLVTGMRTGAVYRVPLDKDGTAAAGPPLEYFRGANRYRDTAVAPDGRRIFVVTDSVGSVLDAQWQRTETLAEPGALLEFTYVPASRQER
jgi:glucose/arabinose dehydrogenase